MRIDRKVTVTLADNLSKVRQGFRSSVDKSVPYWPGRYFICRNLTPAPLNYPFSFEIRLKPMCVLSHSLPWETNYDMKSLY